MSSLSLQSARDNVKEDLFPSLATAAINASTIESSKGQLNLNLLPNDLYFILTTQNMSFLPVHFTSSVSMSNNKCPALVGTRALS